MRCESQKVRPVADSSKPVDVKIGQRERRRGGLGEQAAVRAQCRRGVRSLSYFARDAILYEAALMSFAPPGLALTSLLDVNLVSGVAQVYYVIL